MMMMMETEADLSLSQKQWRARGRAHRERVFPWVEGYRNRRARAQVHPVIDFLFTYYSFRPGQLLRWSPGFGIGLEDPAEEFAAIKEFSRRGGCAVLEIDRMSPRTRRLVNWTGELMERTAGRSGRFGCFGLHEWAMVYRLQERDIRHASFPLRLSPEEIAELVEAQPLCCTHYDAFRFFTSAARPLNALQPGPDDRLEFEQPGCLHTNMDLYKWCYKLSPWIPSELIGDAFLLAAEIRELDMRASPYDLAALGYAPVKIETTEGRSEYEQRQREFAAVARPIREQLADCCRQLRRVLEQS